MVGEQKERTVEEAESRHARAELLERPHERGPQDLTVVREVAIEVVRPDIEELELAGKDVDQSSAPAIRVTARRAASRRGR